MMALHFFERVGSLRLLAALRRLALLSFCLALAACGGGSADAPPPPESVPIVATQPADQSVVAGTTATFAVSASGATPLAYQWSSSADGVAYSVITGATAASYAAGATTLAQSGTRFRVVISNSLGSVTSSAALLTVTPLVVAPLIVTPPADQTVIAPATATFNVTASGSTPSYQWQSSSDGGTTFNAVAGAANAPTLPLTNTTVAQSGQRFRVVASNSAGSATSPSALLTVTAASIAPAFTLQPVSQSITVGQASGFNVAASGTPAPGFQWRLNGAPLGNGTQAGGVCAGATVNGAMTAVLTLSAVPIGCSGAVFSAVASNGVNPDATSNGATLTVTPGPQAPVITLQPGDATVPASSSATFTSAANGVPSPTVQWQQNIGGVWITINGATSATYTTPGTAGSDTGQQFRAVFANASGFAISNAATLTVTTVVTVPLKQPTDVAVDAAGNVYAAFGYDDVILKITPSGVVSNFAGLLDVPGSADGTGTAARFNEPYRITIDSAGNLYVADAMNELIRKITPAGVVTTLAGLVNTPGSSDGTGSAARFNHPFGIAVDASGNIYVGDTGNDTIRIVSPAGVVSTLAGAAGIQDYLDGSSGPTSRFNSPQGVAVDSAGNVYVADTFNLVIRVVSPTGVTRTLAGTPHVYGNANGTGSSAQFNAPAGIAIDLAGNLYVTDFTDTIRKVTQAGVVTTFAGVSGAFGDIDGPSTTAEFRTPTGIAIDSAGNFYIADRDNKAIRKITPAGVVSTLAQ